MTNGRTPWGMSWGRLAIMVVIFFAVIAIVYVAITAMGIVIPHWALMMFWILVIAFFAVLAVKLLLSM